MGYKHRHSIMTIADIERIAIDLFGTSTGWQTKIAAFLGVDARTVRRWIARGEIPLRAEIKLQEAITKKTLQKCEE